MSVTEVPLSDIPSGLPPAEEALLILRTRGQRQRATGRCTNDLAQSYLLRAGEAGYECHEGAFIQITSTNLPCNKSNLILVGGVGVGGTLA